MKSKSVVIPKAEFEFTFELNIAKKSHKPNWEY
jgi:hypothetical protein